MRDTRMIYAVNAPGTNRGGLRTPRGPHLLLRDAPRVGETIAAVFLVRERDVGEAQIHDLTNDETRRLAESFPEIYHHLHAPTISWSVYRASCNGGDTARVYSTEATARGLGDDSDPHEPRDVTAEWIREILIGAGEWDCASCEIRLDDSDPVLVIKRDE